MVFPFLNDALDLSRKIFTKAVLVILEVRIQKNFFARRPAPQYQIGGYGTGRA